MSGHSKWSSIKRAKGVADARRGQLFTKLTREIIMAAREGGGNPDGNFQLRMAIQKARDSNMPNDNIDRAIKRGTGELEGARLEEIVLEGYGPGGVAILVQALSDNRNRTLQEVRNVFTRNGSSLGENGCVAWLFDARGMITVPLNDQNAEELELQAIDAGAEDVSVENDCLEIYTKPEELEMVRAAMAESGLTIASAELCTVPKTTIEVDEKVGLQTLRLLDKLEDLDDVNQVTSNADFSDDVIEKYNQQA